MTLSEKLSQSTKSCHDSLEQQMRSDRIFAHEYSTNEYATMLLSAWYFQKTYEAPVFAALKDIAGLELDKRSKIAALEKDLQAMQVPLPAQASEKNIITLYPPTALGYLYLMEGASLGGNVIRKQLQRMPQFAHIYFNYHYHYGTATGAYWQKFLAVINALPDLWHNEVIAGAKEAYASYSNMVHIVHHKNMTS